MGAVVKFPHRIVLEGKVRSAQRRISKQLDIIENCDIHSKSAEERVKAGLAPMAIEWAQEDLRAAQVELALLDAGDALHHNGVTYAEMAGRA